MGVSSALDAVRMGVILQLGISFYLGGRRNGTK